MDRPPLTPPPSTGIGLLHALGAALVSIALTACAGIGAPPTATEAPITTPTAQAAWPRTIVDDEGTILKLAEPPQRVISLSPANTEIVFALGAGDRLVGGTDFDDYPPAAVTLPDVATFTGVLHEVAAGLDPDLVIAAGNNFTPAGDIEHMRDLGLSVLVVYAETVADVIDDIRLIGRALGADEAADQVVGRMEVRIAEVEAAVAALDDRPRVFYQIGSEPEIYAPAPDSFIADMVVLAGGEAITTADPAVFSISVEQLVAQDPEVIVVGDAAYGVCPAQVAGRPGWGTITAIREGAIRPVHDTIVTRPGPRLAEGLAALALAIHPTAGIVPPADLPLICAEGRATR